MASTTSADDWPGQRLNHAEFGRILAARRAALGEPVMPRNAGTRRTPSKRALLAAIERAGGAW
ncbi:hypothetical protein [Sphingomonas bacterium]|uniref:hypothetical protein n=1 Tax=Sphingomonas bacterium TaxID=1895847 RepID=UPI001577067F|nr:hypothetical protein [Sphingomonas bacterium]